MDREMFARTSLIIPIMSRRCFSGSISRLGHVVPGGTYRLRQGNELTIKTWKESLEELHKKMKRLQAIHRFSSRTQVNGRPLTLRIVDLTLTPTLILSTRYTIICRC